MDTSGRKGSDMNIFSLFTLCGGLAFFLYGMTVMSKSLEKMAGGKLERLLKRMTSNPIKSLLLGAGITIAIQNGGGLRASIQAGPVTMGDVLTVLPFQNTLSTFQLKGSDVVAALENGASQIEDQAGRFAQVAGLKYTVDPAAPAGSRISDVEVRSGASWVPIDNNAVYGVVSQNYMRAGGDGYKVMAEKGMNAYDFGPDLADVLADYLSKQGPDFIAKTDGRITVK